MFRLITDNMPLIFAVFVLGGIGGIVIYTGIKAEETAIKCEAYEAAFNATKKEAEEAKAACSEEHRILVRGLKACVNLRALESTPLFSNNPEITEMIDDFYAWESEVEAAKKVVHTAR